MKMMSKLETGSVYVFIVFMSNDFIVLRYQVHRFVKELVILLIDRIKAFILWMILIHNDKGLHYFIDIMMIKMPFVISIHDYILCKRLD